MFSSLARAGLLALAALTTALTIGLPAQGSETLSPRQEQVFRATCDHYAARRAAPVADPAPLLRRLAASCDRALADLADPATGPEARQSALGYLERLAEFKATVVTITMRRMLRGETRGRNVTKTGEYLIARRMGLLDRYADWAAASGFTIAGSD
jgi:hypothetical protein